MRVAGGRFDACVVLFLMTAFISMWISNTVTTAIMPPGAEYPGGYERQKAYEDFSICLTWHLLLCSIGGIGTILVVPQMWSLLVQENQL